MNKRICIVTLILLLAATFAASAQSSQKREIRRMREAVVGAYWDSELGKLDARLRRGKVKLIIEHSIIDVDGKPFEIRRFASFKQMERWLRSREVENEAEGVGKYRLPMRVVDTFAGCRRGACRYYSPNGILHNHLYLKKILYGFGRGRAFVKTIYLYDGD